MTMPIAKPFFGGYLAGWRNLRPSQLPSQINFLLYAFAEIDAAGVPSIKYGPSASAMKADNDARKALNPPKLAVLSLGGWNGTAAGITTLTQENNMVNGCIKLCDDYGFVGIDWDIEGSEAAASSTTRIVNISRRLKAHYAAQGKEFLITMVPYGSVESTYRVWANALWPDNLDMVFYQHYNGEHVPTTQEVRDEITSWKNDLPGMTNADYGMGHVHLHAWPEPLGTIRTPYTTMRDIWNGVKTTHPGLGGIWAWDITYGNGDTDVTQFVNTVYPSVGAPSSPDPEPEPDTTPPSVNITSHTNGQTVSGTTNIIVSATDADSGVARVEFRINGALRHTETAAPYNFNFNTTSVADGNITVEVTGFDNEGNNASDGVILTVDNAPEPTPDTVTYIDAFQHAATLIHANSTRAQVMWTPLLPQPEDSVMALGDWFPGTTHVDVLGMTVRNYGASE